MSGWAHAVPRRTNPDVMEHYMPSWGCFRATPELVPSVTGQVRGVQAGPSQPLRRALTTDALQPTAGDAEGLQQILRGEFQGDVQSQLNLITRQLDVINRSGILTSNSGFPVRENLEAPATALVPLETPLRSKLPRVPGTGIAHSWRTITSLGGGWGSSYTQPGGGSSSQIFYAENGAPATMNTVYSALSASYARLGTMGSVSRFAMAAGQSFQPQYETEMMNQIKNLSLLEEFSLINADSTSTAAPWGDGTTSYAYDGLLRLVSTGYGVPSANIQTGVGTLTTAWIDSMLNLIWDQGGKGLWMMMNIQEAQSLTALMEASGTFVRGTVMQSGPQAGRLVAGLFVEAYNHPASGEQVPILRSRFMPAGTIVFGSDFAPDGKPALEVVVLPQVEMPALAPGAMLQGYAAQPVGPTPTAPDILSFLVSVYEVPALKAATVFAKGTGITAVS